MPDYY